MKIRWIPIATMAMGLTLAPAIVGAQMPPGGGMGPGMRGGRGMGDMMQMRGMMQQMQGMMQNMADMLKSGTMSPDQMKRMGELIEQMTAYMGQAHDMMGGMGPGEHGPWAMHEQMARMQQHMADMQKHMVEMMGGPPSAAPPASPGKK